MAKLITEWSARQLRGVPVLAADGLYLGRLDAIVHHADGSISALIVRRRRLGSYSSMALLEGAELRDGAIHLNPLAAYLAGSPTPAEGQPHHAA